MESTCDACGSDFHPTAAAWFTRRGACIAAEIELSLMCPLLRLGDRKPLRRAPAAAESDVADNRQEKAA